jgi:hypothetical protein
MKARVFAAAVVAAGLAGCATDYVPPPPVNKPGPEYSDRHAYPPDRGPGMLGDLTWRFSLPGKAEPAKPAPAAAPASAAEQEEFKKWRESASSTERSEFEEWRAWQDWKRKNPK